MESYRSKPFADIAFVATNAIDGRINTVGTWHKYDPRHIDWKLNPVYNGYTEYVWQLGRMYFLNDVAVYYSKTRDPRAARFWVDCISSWIEQADYDEPRETGFDGTCWRSLDAAIRLSGWTSQFPIFKDSPILTDDFIVRFLASVKLHCEHIKRYNTNRNWLIYELTGLLRAAVVFPFIEGAAEWKKFALDKMESELGRQLYPDGFHYELSSGYHSVIPLNYGAIYDFLVKMGEDAPEFLENGLESSFDLYVKLRRPDGKLPPLNDAGEARVKPMMENANRFYPRRTDFLWFATDGLSGALPDYKSVALEYSGSVVMRTGWSAGDIWAYMDCGPVGRGHQHEDKLNVLLWAYGKEMLTEGGIYIYDKSDMRQYVLATASHNTARIGGKNQNRRVGYVWRDEDLYKKAPFKYGFDENVEWCSARYSEGYGNKRELKAQHERTLVFHKNPQGLMPFFAVIDRLEGDAGEAHDYEIMWHLEKCGYSQSDQSFSADFGNGVFLNGFVNTDRIVDKIGQKEPYLQGWKPVFKEGPHEHRPIHTPVVCGKFTGSRRIVTILYPADSGGCPIVRVAASANVGERSYSIILSDGTEYGFAEPSHDDSQCNDPLKSADAGAIDRLAGGFREVPMSARPHVWWHWMNGNVSKEGITADLEAMKEMGIGGASVFDAGCGVPRGPVRFRTQEWFGLLDHAAKEAKRLGIELATTTCSGWSCAGGPWITPAMGMKRLAHTSLLVSGGKKVRAKLEAIPDPHGFSEDIAIVAVPEIKEKENAPFVGCRFQLDYPRQWQCEGEGIVEISEDGAKWSEFCRFDANVARRGDADRTLRYAAFPKPLAARHKRIRFRFWDWASKKDFTGRIKVVRSEFTTCAGIPRLQEKILDRRGEFDAETAEFDSGLVVKKNQVIDVARFVRNGVLEWDAPAGEWRIVRIGYYADGRKNHPASDGGEGFEVDKLSAEALDFHFDNYAGKIKGFDAVLVDSYEAGTQNWTQGLEREFEKRRGYAMDPFYPVFAGIVVGSLKESESFLYDFRKTVSELFCENFAGRLAARCREKGMKLILEPYGNCPCDDLDFGRHADIPQCEFWSWFEERGDYCTDVGNARVPAYLAHFWGRRYVGAEAFTSYHGAGGRWLTTPFRIKAQADRAFAEGVNRLTFHRFAHQPWVGKSAPKPGMTMGCWGMHLDRTQTWWKQGRDWMKYLGRCQWMLQEGRFAADFLFVAGDDVPNRGGHLVGFPKDFDWYSPPLGYSWDVCSREAFKSVVKKGDKFVSPGGVEYAMVVTQCTENATLPCGPDFICLKAPGGVEKEARFIHRIYDDGIEAYFVAQPNRQEGIVTASFRIVERIPELWDAETGKIGMEPLEWSQKDGRTEVSWKARPSGSVFVVFRKPVKPEGTWKLSFPVDWYSGGSATKSIVLADMVDWSTLEDEDMRYFSGTAEYEYQGDLAGVRSVDLGKVHEFAEVFVNGRQLVALWRPPYRFDLPDCPITNLRIKVTNLWPNRIIGDERTKKADSEWEDPAAQSTYKRTLKAIPAFVREGKPSPTGRKTFTTWHHWYKDDKLRPSGILGPLKFR